MEHKIESYSLNGKAITITSDGKGYNLYIDGKYIDSNENKDRLHDVARRKTKDSLVYDEWNAMLIPAIKAFDKRTIDADGMEQIVSAYEKFIRDEKRALKSDATNEEKRAFEHKAGQKKYLAEDELHKIYKNYIDKLDKIWDKRWDM